MSATTDRQVTRTCTTCKYRDVSPIQWEVKNESSQVASGALGRRDMEWSSHGVVERLHRSGCYGADLVPVGDDRTGYLAWKTLLERPKVTAEWVEYAHQRNLNYDELRVHMEVL